MELNFAGLAMPVSRLHMVRLHVALLELCRGRQGLEAQIHELRCYEAYVM